MSTGGGGLTKGVERTASGWDLAGYRSFVRFLEAVAAGPADARLLSEPGVAASISPGVPDRSIFNSVAYEHPAALADALPTLRDAYEAAGVRAWTVWVPDQDRVSAGRLAALGHLLDSTPRSMLLDLEELSGRDEELDFARGVAWPEVCAVNDAAYGLEAGTFERGLGSKPDRKMRGYGARHDGWLASVLGTVLHEGDCGVYVVATLPEARRRRLAGRLLHRALLDAREHGCTTSTLQSSAMGASVYRRLGYRDLGGLEMWEHRSST